MSSSELFCRQLYGSLSSRRGWIRCSSAFLPGCWSSCQMLTSFGHYKPGADLNWWHKGERLHIPLPKPHIPLLISCAIWPTNNINFLTLAIIILHKNFGMSDGVLLLVIFSFTHLEFQTPFYLPSFRSSFFFFFLFLYFFFSYHPALGSWKKPEAAYCHSTPQLFLLEVWQLCWNLEIASKDHFSSIV